MGVSVGSSVGSKIGAGAGSGTGFGVCSRVGEDEGSFVGLPVADVGTAVTERELSGADSSRVVCWALGIAIVGTLAVLGLTVEGVNVISS